MVLEPGELNKLAEHVETYVSEGRRPQEAVVIAAEETADVVTRLYQHLVEAIRQGLQRRSLESA